MKMEAIKLKKVTKIYESRTVVNNASFFIKSSSFVSIVGRSGSGKSTLLNMIGSLEKPDEGSIIVNDLDISKASKKEISYYRNKTIGFVFQSFHLEPSYDVFHNVAIPLYIAGEKNIKKRVENALEIVGLADRIHSNVTKLSGGERQRVSIARAIINDPKIILADEPCGNLDTENSGVIMDLLRKLVDDGKCVLLVTHDLDDAAKTDRIITINDGSIISDKVIKK